MENMMGIIRYLLSAMFKIAVILFCVAIVWWLVSTLIPGLSYRSIFLANGTSTEARAWLPAPGSWKGVFGHQKTATGNLYIHGDAYNGYGNTYNGNQGGAQVKYVSYTVDGKEVVYGNNSNEVVFDSQNQIASNQNVNSEGYSQRNLYVRNLSIYEGGHAYTGLSFVGEARNTMFQEGKFPIIIVNNVGQVVSVSKAEATSNWSVPGWTKFQVRINDTLPNKVPCTMVFESAKPSYSYQYVQTIRVAVPVMCN